MTPRRFPPPWSVDELEECFAVKDVAGQKLAYVYFEEEPGRRSVAKLLTKDEADCGECSLYSHGEYRHCTAEDAVAGGTGRGEGSAAGTGRGECTRAAPNVQQWLVPSQIRCALGNLARASLSVMQACEPLASDGPMIIATAKTGIIHIVFAKADQSAESER